MQVEKIGNCVLYCGDCLNVMPTLPGESIHSIIADLPYGTTYSDILPRLRSLKLPKAVGFECCLHRRQSTLRDISVPFATITFLLQSLVVDVSSKPETSRMQKMFQQGSTSNYLCR